MDRRHGAIALSVLASGIGGLALAALSLVEDPWEFMLLYGVVGGIAWVGQTNIVSAAIIPKWFVDKRSMAMAIGTTGGGFAALVLPLIAAATISAVGWRDAWVIYGVITFVVGVPLAFLIKRQPEDVGLHPDGKKRHAKPAGPNANVEGTPLSVAVRMKTTWLLIGAVALASLPSIGIPANMVPLFEDRGFSQTGAAVALSIYGLMSVSGRYVWGYVSARTSVRKAFLWLVALGVVIMIMFNMVATNQPVLLCLAAGIGLVIGGMIVLNPLIWPAYLGRGHLGAIHGLVYPLVSLIMSLGPVVLSLAFDLTGSYGFGLWIIAITYALSFVVMWTASEPNLRQ